MPAKGSPLSRTWATQTAKLGVPRKLRVTYLFGKQGGEEGEGVFRDDGLFDNIQRSSIPMITLMPKTAVKRTEKTYGGLAPPLEKKTERGRPKRPHCGVVH